MILWSIQNKGFYETLLRNGVVSGDFRRVSKSDRPYYRWMSMQMYLRWVSENANRAPIRTWFGYGGKSKRRPDLRHSVLLPPKSEGVRLQVDIHPDKCLLSQFLMWNHTLSNWYISENFEEDEYIDKLEKTSSLT